MTLVDFKELVLDRVDDVVVGGIVVPLLAALVAFFFEKWARNRRPENSPPSGSLIAKDVGSLSRREIPENGPTDQTKPKRKRTSSFKLVFRIFLCFAMSFAITYGYAFMPDIAPIEYYGYALAILLTIAAFNAFRLFLRLAGFTYRLFFA